MKEVTPLFNEIFFFMYIFAAFVGCLVILLAILLIKHWASGNKNLLSAIRNFMICTALIDALYFFMEYYALRYGAREVLPVSRVLDVCLFVGQVYFWAVYVREKAQLQEKWLCKLSCILTIICVPISIVSYGFLMDDYYFTQPGIDRILAVCIEIVIGTLLTFITLWNLKRILPELVQERIRKLVIGISVLITCNGVWNAILVVCLMTGIINEAESAFFDPTSVLIFLTNLLTIFLVCQEDFSAQFRFEENEDVSRLDFLAELHGLTQREREVMELAYEGMTNPEIAEELVISKYTVKRHMHNIFEKLDISTRMELVHLVNQENGPGGSLPKSNLLK